MSSKHEDITCDGCSKKDFRLRRYKCLRCIDYDLCGLCFDNLMGTSGHKSSHPMQCLITKADHAIFYKGEETSKLLAMSFTCPLCGQLGFSESSLSNHVFTTHSKERHCEVLCPFCVFRNDVDPNAVIVDLANHFKRFHKLTYTTTNDKTSSSKESYQATSKNHWNDLTSVNYSSPRQNVRISNMRNKTFNYSKLQDKTHQLEDWSSVKTRPRVPSNTSNQKSQPNTENVWVPNSCSNIFGQNNSDFNIIHTAITNSDEKSSTMINEDDTHESFDQILSENVDNEVKKRLQSQDFISISSNTKSRLNPTNVGSIRSPENVVANDSNDDSDQTLVRDQSNRDSNCNPTKVSIIQKKTNVSNAEPEDFSTSDKIMSPSANAEHQINDYMKPDEWDSDWKTFLFQLVWSSLKVEH